MLKLKNKKFRSKEESIQCYHNYNTNKRVDNIILRSERNIKRDGLTPYKLKTLSNSF